MTSIERIREYIKLPPEGDLNTSKDPSASWPEYGNITFDKLSFRHSKNLPSVLNNISCTILGQEKVSTQPALIYLKSSSFNSKLYLLDWYCWPNWSW